MKFTHGAGSCYALQPSDRGRFDRHNHSVRDLPNSLPEKIQELTLGQLRILLGNFSHAFYLA
jgi:hypothetical protein